ncbi:MAG: glycosyltransferase family 4 protein [Vicinamibacterales bacterium]
MSSLRFCILTTFYPPFNFGGDGIDVQRMARALVQRGHQVTVVHDVNSYEWLAGRHLPDQPVMQDDVEVIGLRSRLGVISPLLTHQFGWPVVQGRAIDALLRQRTPDVIVFGNVSLLGGPGILTLGGDALKVYVAHEHWLVCPTHVLWRFNREPCDARACTRCVLSYGRPPQLWRYTGALKRRLPDVDLFVARSEFSRDKHREFGFDRPMEVLPYFLPGDYPVEPGSQTSERPQNRPYFLYVGRLVGIKGLHSVIPAFRRYPHADWLIIGDGEEMTALRDLAADVPNVKFVGRVDNQDLGRYYEHAIAAIVPSVGFETFGIVVIEAFRHQTPVIARRIGPFPEIVETVKGGLLFSDTDELVEAMRRLHEDPALRQAMGSHAYRAGRELWSEGPVIDRFLDLVEKARAAKRLRKDANRV